jgi:hypothetical protein
MNLLKHSPDTLKVCLSDDDRRNIRGCIRECDDKLTNSEALDRTGVDREYLFSIVKYFGKEHPHGIMDCRCPSPTLILVKVNDEEYHLSMSMQDAELIVKCLETALQVIPDWETHILLGVDPYEIKDLLAQFRNIL